MKKIKTISVLDSKFKAEVLMKDPGSLDLNAIPAIQLLHERVMAKRQRGASAATPGKFKVTCLDDLPIDEEVSADELEAERLVTHERVVITDKNFNVIHGHESVLKAAIEKTNVLVLRALTNIGPKEVFLLQVRHAAKEGMLHPAPRVESIRILHDDYGLDIQQIRSLMVGPKNKKPSGKEVEAELRTGRIFEDHPGYKIPFTGHELDRHSFSNIKYLVGNKIIYEEMQRSKAKQEHFLRMAITATKTRSKRLNTDVPPLMKHSDTRDLLFNQGIVPAQDLARAKYPHENTESHPQNDVIAATAKIKRSEMMVLLKRQLDQNSVSHPLFKQIMELVDALSDISETARREWIRHFVQSAPSEVADALAESYPQLAVEGVKRNHDRLAKLVGQIQ